MDMIKAIIAALKAFFEALKAFLYGIKSDKVENVSKFGDMLGNLADLEIELD